MNVDRAALARLLFAGSWSADRGRLFLTGIAIALGIALGTTVHLVNHSAAVEFEAAVRALSGDADIRIAGPRSGFDETVYPVLSRRPEVAVASPALEIDAKVADSANSRIKIVGLDPFRAMQLQPGLFGGVGDRLIELLRPHTVMLNDAAARRWALDVGDRLQLQVGMQRVSLEVIAILPPESARQPFALMDIGAAQWSLAQVGRISRVDIRLRPGVSIHEALARLQPILPPGVVALEAERESERGLSLSRAYRVNLNMLALVSLFTGAVLVFSTQSLSVLRRRAQFGLLRALGMSARMLTTLIAFEAAVLGCLGTIAGLILGIGAARLAIAFAGADLGAGFFSGVVANLEIDPLGLLVIAATGIVASTLGGTIPAIEAAHANPARALRAGDEQETLSALPRRWPAAVLIAAAGVLVLLPAVDGIAMFGYAAIAALLLGSLMLMPDYVRAALALLPQPGTPMVWLGTQQLRGAHGYAGISLAGMLTSFSLVVAMLVMIHSFRSSLGNWLEVVLPADLYARAAGGASGWIDADAQAAIGAVPAVRRVVYSRYETLLLAGDKAPVTLIARDIDAMAPDALPLVSAQSPPPTGMTPIWISEAVRDIYGVDVGDRMQLPIRGKILDAQVAGIWRDYVRQGGAILIPRDPYRRASGDDRANEAWLWLQPQASADAAMIAIRSALGSGKELEIREPGRLRELSLAAFDRTFAVTYALQFAALIIGLFGISVGTSAQALARRREFGMLRHVGLSLNDLRTTIGIEGGMLGALGALAGAAIGGVMSLVLIHVINRQSFHWSMDVHVPWSTLITLALIMTACASLVAVMSVRRVIGNDIVAAVKEDW